MPIIATYGETTLDTVTLACSILLFESILFLLSLFLSLLRQFSISIVVCVYSLVGCLDDHLSISPSVRVSLIGSSFEKGKKKAQNAYAHIITSLLV
jgi:hypothetical protein